MPNELSRLFPAVSTLAITALAHAIGSVVGYTFVQLGEEPPGNVTATPAGEAADAPPARSEENGALALRIDGRDTPALLFEVEGTGVRVTINLEDASDQAGDDDPDELPVEGEAP